jgi:Pyridine nucleotide-disulphide oxidoreductase, dimerisation domain
VKLLADSGTRLLLGVHIIGPQASILIQPLVQAMCLGNTVDEVASGVLYIHPGAHRGHRADVARTLRLAHARSDNVTSPQITFGQDQASLSRRSGGFAFGPSGHCARVPPQRMMSNMPCAASKLVATSDLRVRRATDAAL